jgi:hypothetical protein
MVHIPDHPTIGRWCKECRDFRPVCEFISCRRTFTCRQHEAIARNKWMSVGKGVWVASKVSN